MVFLHYDVLPKTMHAGVVLDAKLATDGAWGFFVARCVYVPAYAFGPTGLRSICWQVGQIGILVILADLFF